MRLILASASPRRAELLAAAGYTCEARSAEVDERVLAGEQPRDYVRRLAREKSQRVMETLGAPADVLILGADTAVIVDDEILGKPADDLDAARMLRLLSGRTHIVMTGVSLRTAVRQVDAVDETVVFVEALADEQVAWYVGSGEGRDKAGAYAIQGLGSRFIPRIEGSYANVVGLPVALVSKLMSDLR